MKVLRKIEELKVKNLTGDDFRRALKQQLEKHLPEVGSNSEERKLNERRDQSSHFILRLAYCRTEDLRRWLLTQETALFRYRLERLESLDPKGLAKFLSAANMTFDKVPEAEKRALQTYLTFNLSLTEFSNNAFYKIPFASATDLVARREVYVTGGYAYVPGGKLVNIVTSRFRADLSKALAKAAAGIASICEDGRIGPLLKNMNKQYTGRDFGQETGVEGELNAHNIDEYAGRSMPLCMRQAHMGLKRDHKLKHDGRRQYGLFLKGAGLSMEESIQFFQAEFTKIMSSDDFNKSYLYNIRHSYGKEGVRKSYTPFSCMTIIMGPRANPGEVGSHHGCPFAHMGDGGLNALLGQLQIAGPDRDAIMKHKKDKQYQLACREHFLAVHPDVERMGPGGGRGEDESVSMDGVANHPNQWFVASTKYWKVKGLKSKKAAPETKKGSIEAAMSKKAMSPSGPSAAERVSVSPSN